MVGGGVGSDHCGRGQMLVNAWAISRHRQLIRSPHLTQLKWGIWIFAKTDMRRSTRRSGVKAAGLEQPLALAETDSTQATA